MPSAALDQSERTRFIADFESLLAAAGLPEDAAVGVALSGGPDSLALLVLTASCASGRVAAMTVDHGLRRESAAEAETAGKVAALLDVPHSIARVSVPGGGEGRQGEARRVRYAALGDWAQRENLDAILTAHHADDQAETLLMRLSRGAGLSGLSGIRAFRPLVETDPTGPLLLRPLLGWRKAELEAIVSAAGLIPARDPSNDDPQYDRTAARRLIAETPWLDPLRLARSARAIAEADATLAAMADALRETAVTELGDAASLTPPHQRDLARRLLLRLFADRFAARPDGPAVERTLDALGRGETVTLADIICKSDGALWTFRPAPPRRGHNRSD
jgi:tRNA(Ile)-lysidine synthase